MFKLEKKSNERNCKLQMYDVIKKNPIVILFWQLSINALRANLFENNDWCFSRFVCYWVGALLQGHSVYICICYPREKSGDVENPA